MGDLAMCIQYFPNLTSFSHALVENSWTLPAEAMVLGLAWYCLIYGWNMQTSIHSNHPILESTLMKQLPKLNSLVPSESGFLSHGNPGICRFIWISWWIKNFLPRAPHQYFITPQAIPLLYCVIMPDASRCCTNKWCNITSFRQPPLNPLGRHLYRSVSASKSMSSASPVSRPELRKRPCSKSK